MSLPEARREYCQLCRRRAFPDLRGVTFADFSGKPAIQDEPAGLIWVCGSCEPAARELADLTLGRAWVRLGKAKRAQDDLPAPLNRPGPALLVGDIPVGVGIQDQDWLSVRLGKTSAILLLDRVDARVPVSFDDHAVLLDGPLAPVGRGVQWQLVNVPNSGHSRECRDCSPEAWEARFDAVVADEDLIDRLVFLVRLPQVRRDDCSSNHPGWWMPAEGVWLWRGRTTDTGLAVVERVTEHETADLVVLEEAAVALPADPQQGSAGSDGAGQGAASSAAGSSRTQSNPVGPGKPNGTQPSQTG